MSETETTDLTSETPAPENRPPAKPSVGITVPATVNYGGASMEARVASIEAHVDHMRDDVGDIRRDFRELTKSLMSATTDMRELDDRMSSLPGRGSMFVIMLLFTAIICAVVIYLEQIRQYLNVLPPSSGVP